MLRVTKNRSLFPRATSISKHFSPYTLLKGKQIDYNKDFSCSFGDYVMASYERIIKNNNYAGAIDAIYLRADDADQGAHQVMDLSTGKMVRRPYVLKCVMIKLVINRVKQMAEK